MTYRVRFSRTGSLHESTPQTFEEARITAVCLSNWNQRVEIIDLDTGEILKEFPPYSEEGAAQLEQMHADHMARMEKLLAERKGQA